MNSAGLLGDTGGGSSRAMTSNNEMRDRLPASIIAQLRASPQHREALAYIDRCSLPSTTPNGSKSYTVRYPCDLTGEVLVLSSRDIELAAVHTLLGDPEVLFFIPQPADLELELDNPRHRFYPPDFLVFYKDGRKPVLLETKPTTHLAERVAKLPSRYTCDGSNGYAMPLAAAAAAKLGFDFRVVSERHFDETFLRNAQFLESYRKWDINPPASDAEKQAIKDQIAADSGIKMAAVKHDSTQRRADLIYHMIACGDIFTHLSLERLADQNRVASALPGELRRQSPPGGSRQATQCG